MSSAREWIGERVPVSLDGVAAMSNEPVPNHMKRWWFALGGTPAYLFVVQIVTGVLLAFYYQPSPSTAYESVRYITEQAAFGWYLRGLHRWGATLMIAAVGPATMLAMAQQFSSIWSKSPIRRNFRSALGCQSSWPRTP